MQIIERFKLMAAVGIIFGLILSGCGRQNETSGPPPGGAPEVAVVTIQPKQVVITTELAGRTSANLVAEVRPQVSGIIQKRLFTEGSDVKAGQVLFRIDAAPFQAALDNAKAALSRSKANLSAIRLRADRFRELLADKAVSQQDCDDAAAALKQTEADIQYWKATVETARINLKYTSVTAPISGPHRKIQCHGGRPGDGTTARSPGYHSTTGSHVRGCSPIHDRSAAIAAPPRRTAASIITGRFGTRSVLFWKTTANIPWKGRFNSATSRSIRRPDRSFCGLSFPIRRAFSCRACSSGR